MALTAKEEYRIQQLEVLAIQLNQLIKGASSENQLNRLLVLAQDDMDKLKIAQDELDIKVEELLELTRKLQ